MIRLLTSLLLFLLMNAVTADSSQVEAVERADIDTAFEEIARHSAQLETLSKLLGDDPEKLRCSIVKWANAYADSLNEAWAVNVLDKAKSEMEHQSIIYRDTALSIYASIDIEKELSHCK